MTPHPSPITLVVLAAGLGTRYGGVKQLDPLGPGGATLMDYSVYDAVQAGFTRAVFVLRREIVSEFERTIGARYRTKLTVETVCQHLDALPPGFSAPKTRSRPWGTVQATLVARELVPGPFALLNADDVYGREAIQVVADFLRQASPGSTLHAVVGFRLESTASPSGGVSRAVLSHGADGNLREVLEIDDLVRTPAGDYQGRLRGAPIRVDASAPVSMNLWAFGLAIFPVLDSAFKRFLSAHHGDTAELRVAEAVQEGLARQELAVRVLSTGSQWCGVTHPADRDWVRARLEEQVRSGAYPERLW